MSISKNMKKLWSIFTDDMETCYITGFNSNIERHHVFEGRQGFRSLSEKYGFVVTLHRSVHPNGAWVTDKNWTDLDHYLKRKCQEYYLEHYGDRDKWYQEFGRYYDDWDDEKVWRNNHENDN